MKKLISIILAILMIATTLPFAFATDTTGKGGFTGFIWKIVNFFWKLFKTHEYCDCGAKHW